MSSCYLEISGFLQTIFVLPFLLGLLTSMQEQTPNRADNEIL
jgi:hypothetical protein